jgi:hypothetical protein
MLRIAALTLLLVSISAATLSADEKSHRAAVEELLMVTKTPENMDASIDMMLDMQIKQAPPLAPLKKPMREFFTKYLSYKNLKDELITLYAEEFTEDECRELIKFYETPVGKKMADKQPKLAAKGAQLGASKVDAHKAELQQLIRDELLKGRTEPAPEK